MDYLPTIHTGAHTRIKLSCSHLSSHLSQGIALICCYGYQHGGTNPCRKNFETLKRHAHERVSILRRLSCCSTFHSHSLIAHYHYFPITIRSVYSHSQKLLLSALLQVCSTVQQSTTHTAQRHAAEIPRLF